MDQDHIEHAHTEHEYHRGVGVILELDQIGVWWSKSLGKTFGPCTHREMALAEAQDWIKSRAD